MEAFEKTVEAVTNSLMEDLIPGELFSAGGDKLEVKMMMTDPSNLVEEVFHSGSTEVVVNDLLQALANDDQHWRLADEYVLFQVSTNIAIVSGV